MSKSKILITGANGQLGTALSEKLISIHGEENVFLSDIKESKRENDHFFLLDILQPMKLNAMIEEHKITQIYHLAAVLSAHGEKNPALTWEVNFNGLINILNAAKEHSLDKVFFPSSIGVFGDTTPKINTPQISPLLPETVYGISKVAGELWANYYYKRYNLDVRSVRFPGVIGYQSIPHGGTTDYAVEIYHAAVLGEEYECFLEENTRLPMIYMPDALDAAIDLMQKGAQHILVHSSYNLASMSFTPAEITEAIRLEIPNFQIRYKPDYRQKIAESWTQSIDDSAARKDWGWNPKYNLARMTKDMIIHLRKQYNI